MLVILPEERVGTVVAGRYRIASVIGVGGMGAVFAAVHEFTGRPVAVKFLDPALARDEEASQRFMQEARAAARLDHPNVVDVLDMGLTGDGGVYLVLEHLEGEDLEALLAREGALDESTALDLLLPLIDALAEAHALSIIHRDIKPANIFVAKQRGALVAKILDFGIARMRGHGGAVQTQSGRVLGTPYYMAPEQVKADGSVGPASDVWSMGVVLYRCLSGQLPVKGKSAAEIMMQVVTEPRPALLEAAPALTPAVAHTIDIALSRAPEERHGGMAEFASALRRAAATTGFHARARVVGGVKEAPSMPTESATAILSNPGPGPSDSLSQTTPFSTDTPTHGRRPAWGRGLALGSALAVVAAVAGLTIFILGDGEGDAMSVAPLPSAETPVGGEVADEAEQEVEAAPDSESESGDPELGLLTVRSSRSCILSVDGNDVGGTPVLERQIAVGEHRLECRPRRGEPATAVVAIARGHETEHHFRFGSRGNRRRGGRGGADEAAPSDEMEMEGSSPDITRDYD